MSRCRNVNESQYDPRENLDHEAEKRHASEGVKPAGAAFRNRMTGGRFPKLNQMETAFEPHRNVDHFLGKLLGFPIHKLNPDLQELAEHRP